MNREERVKAALNAQPVDRVPVSAWMHFSEVDQDPISLAQTQVAFNEEYDYDFIKLMPFGTYSVQDWGAQLKIYCHKYHEPIVLSPGIKEVADYTRLQVLPPYYGNWGKQLAMVQELSKLVRRGTPYVQTIFSPLSTLAKLAGPRLKEDMQSHPGEVHAALEAITETTIRFVRENVSAGVSGFFLATQNATSDYMPLGQFREFAVPYDLRVIEAYKDDTYFNILHIHGSNIFFDELLGYPVNCVNWHDRSTAPSLAQARERTGRCFLGGIREVPYFVDGVLRYDSFVAGATPEQVVQHAREAIEQTGGRGFILGPGCVVDPKAKADTLRALRQAVEMERREAAYG